MIKKNYLILVLILLLYGCSSNKFLSYNEFEKVIEIPNRIDTNYYNNRTFGDRKTFLKNNLKTSGYSTSNKEFYEKILKPVLIPKIEFLRSKNDFEIINLLTLFIHESYQNYFGKNFYRWGGDIYDLDDPQDRGNRFDKRFGLDCSGFASSPYEIATDLGLLNAEKTLFCSTGFKKYCQENHLSDKGGINNSSNNFRLDTKDMSTLGIEVFILKKGETPTKDQLKLLKPGDWVGRSGHFGIIVFINELPYYLESGGSVVPKNGGNPHQAEEALKVFAKNGPLSVRRCLK